jgi:hypothetical protein
VEEFDLMAPAYAGLGGGILTREELYAVWEKLWRLLAVRTALYTALDSSSVTVETAQELLASVCFTLRLYLKHSGQSPRLLLNADLRELFAQGVKRTEGKLREAGELWQAVCLDAPELESVSMAETLREIGGFFGRYDRYFLAHQIPCTIDYQLCRAVPETLQGVEFIGEYLRRIRLEIDFLRRFDRKRVIRLLERSCPDYRELPLNLFEPAAVNALGLALSGGDVFSLSVSDEGCERLSAAFAALTEEKARSLLRVAARRLRPALDLETEAAGAYLEQTAEDLYPRIKAALPAGNLGMIFLAL